MLVSFLRKARADIGGRPLQSALIFVVAALATAILATALTTQVTVNHAYETRFDESNGAHVWFYYLPSQSDAGRAAYLDPGDLELIGGLEEVTGASGLIPYVRRSPAILEDGTSVDLRLYGLSSILPEVGRPILTGGRWLESQGGREIVVDHGLARVRDLEIGDRVEVMGRGGPEGFEIVGLTVQPGLSYPHTYSDSLPYATAYVLPTALESIEPDRSLWTWEYGVRITNPGEVWRFSADVRDTYPEGRKPYYLTWDTSQGWVNESVRIYLLLIGLIGVFAIGVAAFVIANTVAGNVLAQVRDVGLLKAVGFTPRQVTLLMLAEHAAIGLVAAVVGVTIGFVTAPLVVQATGNVLGTSPSLVFDPVLMAAIVLGVTFVIAVTAYLPARRAGKTSTVGALTVGVGRPRSSGIRVTRVANFLRLPTVAVVGLKDVFNRPVRSALTIAALVVATIMATFSLGMEATIGDIMEDPRLFGGDPYQITITNREGTDDLTPDGVEALLDGHPEVGSYVAGRVLIGNLTGDAESAGSSEIIRVGANGPGYEDLAPYIPDGRLFAKTGEAIVTERLAREQGLEIGDSLTVFIDDERLGRAGPGTNPLTLEIVGTYVADNLQTMTSLETLRQQLGPDVVPTTYLVRVAEGGDPEALRVDLLRQANDRLTISVSDPVEVTEQTAGYIRPPLYALSVALFLTSVISVLITLLFVVRERYREFAILKTLGFTPKQIAGSILSGSFLLAGVGLVIGIPLGLGFTWLAMDLIGRAAQIDTFGTLPGALETGLLIPVMIVVTALGAILPARRAARITVTEALRFQ